MLKKFCKLFVLFFVFCLCSAQPDAAQQQPDEGAQPDAVGNLDLLSQFMQLSKELDYEFLNITKNSLNAEFGTTGQVHIITVTRGLTTPQNDGVDDAVPPGNAPDDAVQQPDAAEMQLSNIVRLPKLAEYKEFKTDSLNKLCEKLRSEIEQLPPDELKIIVFNEYFFKKDPLENTKFQEFLDIIKETSRQPKCKNAIFYVNFLYKDETPISEWSMAEQIDVILKKKESFVLDKDFMVTDTQNVLERNLQNNVKGIFRNITFAINNGKTITEYKKRTYCREWDFGIANNYIYDFGDGYDYACTYDIYGENINGSNTLRNITTEICFDLAKGVRKENSWTNGPDMTASTLHIIQSNIINVDENVTKENLPRNKLIVHVDPSYGKGNLFYITQDGNKHEFESPANNVKYNLSNDVVPDIVMVKVFSF